ncbi:MAG: LysR family transcriptional regulator [Deltaproteobacteria bacterium]|nr:LysR family transcriptional regulator [Deltaproteobacteria bacterium]
MTTDLNSLMMFAKVVEANSFSEAARRLNMPLSTVSRRIAELETHLGVRLLERSTRRLRLTDVGSELLEHAQRSAELGETVGDIVSNRRSKVSGLLRLSAPPSISDSFLVPLVNAFQTSHPNVRVEVFITDRYVDHIVEGVDLVFRFGALRDSTLVARRILTYRHQLVASPAYLDKHNPPRTPHELLDHRLLAFSYWKPKNSWTFVHSNGKDRETLTFLPYLSMNDYAGLAQAAVAGAGIGDLPPLVRPDLLRNGKLVEIMPKWRLRSFNLSLVRLGNRYLGRPVHLFNEFAARTAPKLFPTLPT